MLPALSLQTCPSSTKEGTPLAWLSEGSTKCCCRDLCAQMGAECRPGLATSCITPGNQCPFAAQKNVSFPPARKKRAAYEDCHQLNSGLCGWKVNRKQCRRKPSKRYGQIPFLLCTSPSQSVRNAESSTSFPARRWAQHKTCVCQHMAVNAAALLSCCIFQGVSSILL